jgi:N-acetylglutamate synthase-like GNAT family acetyltransferase
LWGNLIVNSIVLRPAGIGEQLVLSDLAFRSKAHWGYSDEFMEHCRAELSVSESNLASEHMHYVVAEKDNKIVGFYALERISDQEIELGALFVDPGWLRQGIGKTLMEHCKSKAIALGARFIVIQSDPNAAPFYQTAGGIYVRQRASESIPGRTLPVYRIELNLVGNSDPHH